MTRDDLERLEAMAATLRAHGFTEWPSLIERVVEELRALRDARVDEVSFDAYQAWAGRSGDNG